MVAKSALVIENRVRYRSFASYIRHIAIRIEEE
jgi:hypothetical protein